MGRIADLFLRKNKDVLNVYCTAGFPHLDSTLPVMKALQENGADMIELGMPYSDPLADGPVIQHSSAIAIDNGMTIAVLFGQLKNMRREIHLPVLLMGYMNPVLQYGFERFCRDAAAVGIDGLIIPDLPAYEFEELYSPVIKAQQLDFVFLVTPETADDRIKKLDQLSTGFLYAVSSSSTTGSEPGMIDTGEYLRRLKMLRLKNPVLVGFGIKDRTSYQNATRYAEGGIIGSAYIQCLATGSNIESATREFLALVRG